MAEKLSRFDRQILTRKGKIWMRLILVKKTLKGQKSSVALPNLQTHSQEDNIFYKSFGDIGFAGLSGGKTAAVDIQPPD